MRQRKVDGEQQQDGQDQQSSTLSYSQLISHSPSHLGEARKVQTNGLIAYLPAALLSILLTLPFIGRWLKPSIDKRRNLLIVGSYLYRFSEERESSSLAAKEGEDVDVRVESEDNFKLKGCPIPIKGILASLLTGKESKALLMIDESDDDEEKESLINNKSSQQQQEAELFVFKVQTFRKTQYFAVESEESALTWVNSLRFARSECIKRAMGHSKIPPLASHVHFDTLAEEKYATTLRLDKKEREASLKIEHQTIGMLS
jgi:hypothetical protein